MVPGAEDDALLLQECTCECMQLSRTQCLAERFAAEPIQILEPGMLRRDRDAGSEFLRV
jgi:hypothetical protein